MKIETKIKDTAMKFSRIVDLTLTKTHIHVYTYMHTYTHTQNQKEGPQGRIVKFL